MKLICFPFFKSIILDKSHTLRELQTHIRYCTAEAYDIFGTVVCDAVGWFFYWCLKRTRVASYRARRYDGLY